MRREGVSTKSGGHPGRLGGGLRDTLRYLRRVFRSPSSAPLALAACLTSVSPLAAQWVEPPGQGWVALTTYHQDTRDVYALDGAKDTFAGEGRVTATSSFFTVARGLVPGLDAWAQFSFQRLRFADRTGVSTATGVGDMRFYLRLNPLMLAGIDLPVAVRAGVKLPVGDFDVGSDQLPLGDGQRDWEVMLEAGRSFYPAPFYFMSWARIPMAGEPRQGPHGLRKRELLLRRPRWHDHRRFQDRHRGLVRGDTLVQQRARGRCRTGIVAPRSVRVAEHWTGPGRNRGSPPPERAQPAGRQRAGARVFHPFRGVKIS